MKFGNEKIKINKPDDSNEVKNSENLETVKKKDKSKERKRTKSVNEGLPQGGGVSEERLNEILSRMNG